MKVAVIHNLVYGGAWRRLSEQCRRVPFPIVEVCLAGAAPVTETPIIIPVHPRAATARRLLRPPLRYYDFVLINQAWRRAAAVVHRSEADVVVANPCRYCQAPPALPELEIPSVYFCDEPRRVDYEPSADQSRNPRTRSLYATLYRMQRRADRRAVASAGIVVTNSNYTAQSIQAAYGRSARTMPLGIADAFLEPHPTLSARHILSVGMLAPNKGHDVALEAIGATGSKWRLVLVSPRPEQGEETRLRGLATKLRVELDVRVGISDAQLAELYATAHVLIYAAEREPFGLASLEAQACGCPVIAADDGGLPETLLEDRTGWTVPRTASAIAACLERLDDPATRRAMALAAAAHTAGRTWQAAADSLAEVLVEATA